MITELTNEQRRIFIDTEQVYSAFLETRNLLKSRYKGTMLWKKSKGREYLFRARDSRGYGKSLGARSSENELIFQKFHAEKSALKLKIETLQEKLKTQSLFCKAVKIQRVPSLVTAILRAIEKEGMLDKLQVIGTNSIYAYEVMAGVFFPRDILATQDMDILWDSRSALKVAGNITQTGLLGVLQSVDKSFVKAKSPFRAFNKDGFYVDLVKPEPANVLLAEKTSIGEDTDLVAAEIASQKWLLSSKKINQVVIGEDGYPAIMPVADPRAYALHKLWLSEQEDRDPLKKSKDREQALQIAQLVTSHLPQYSFEENQLKMFPHDILAAAQALPSGFDFESS